MITLPLKDDVLALKIEIGLTGTDFCVDGDHYPIVLPLPEGELNSIHHEQQTGRMSSKSDLWYSDQVQF